MLPESGGGARMNLAGQGLWVISHWDDFQAVEDLQGMLQRRDRSVVGGHFDFRLIRYVTAKDAGMGVTSNVARRRVEVLYLSEDGASCYRAAGRRGREHQGGGGQKASGDWR